MKLKNTFIVVIIIIIAFTFVYALPHNISAQNEEGPVLTTEASLGVARMMDINEDDVVDGSIIVSSERGNVLSTIPYDGNVLGVVARDAAIVLSSSEVSDGIPVMSNGQTYILVSSLEGTIEKGDLLTTSTIPGVAVKAERSGYVLGRALENFEITDVERIEKIAAELDLHYFNSKSTFPGSLTDIFKIALLSTDQAPTPLFKYIVAALVLIGSFILAYMTFSRTAAKGIEALGRNPAAKGTIQLGIIFNVIIVIVIVLAGVTIAFLILRL